MIMTRCLALSIILSGFEVAAQNLVPNPSFEQLDTCTEFLEGVELATFWYAALNSPDLFNSCSAGMTGVPNNICGYQLPATGNGYAGLAAYEDVPGTTLLHHEIICVPLTQPLVVGQMYHASMYVSATTATTIGGGDSRFVSNNLGLLFRMECGHFSLSSSTSINYAHVWTDSIVSDSLNWTLIAGDFEADSSYQYVAIGNFFGDEFTDAQELFPLAETQGSYYYIDDVSVSLIDESALYDNVSLDPPIAYYDANTATITIAQGVAGAVLTIYNPEGRVVQVTRLGERSRQGIIVPFTAPTTGLYVLVLQTPDSITSAKFVKHE